MNRLRLFTIVLISSLSAGPASAAPSADAHTLLGEHHVRTGETLYCIGRGYGVVPSAIASASGLGRSARLYVGQVLRIPAVQWASIPAGPACPPQFQSPYMGQPAPAPAPTPDPGAMQATYAVRRGDTLWRIARANRISVEALKAANSLTSNLIFAGQTLLIPPCLGDPAYPTVCIPPPPPDLDCGEITHRNFVVLPPDPHGFDADRDGVGCETRPAVTFQSQPNCDPAYPGICLPPNLPDLDCGDIPYRNFTVLPPDPHGFDGDKDGVGCET